MQYDRIRFKKFSIADKEDSMRSFDAVVIGAGPAGSILALSLARQGFSVLLTDKAIPGNSRVCGGFLGPETEGLFKQTGLSGIANDLVFHRIREIAVSGPSSICFKTPVTQGTAWAVDRPAFDAYLFGSAQRAGVHCLTETLLGESYHHNGTWKLQFENTRGIQQIECRYLIHATGRRPILKNQPKRNSSLFYACKATYRSVESLEDTVALHFVQKGHVGLNPIGNGFATLCLYVEEPYLKAAAGDLDKMMDGFMEQNSHLKEQLKHAVRTTEWRSCQAEPDDQRVYFENETFFVGDAVSMVHPIIGGGIPIAMSSALMLSKRLVEGMRTNQSLETIARHYRRDWEHRLLRRFNYARLLGGLERSIFWPRMIFRMMRWFGAIFPILVHLSRPQTRRSPESAALPVLTER